MDEAVAGHASFIEVSLEPGNWLTVRDNGRGIPVDPHPKFKNLSALEVILTTLHSWGKFGGKVYATSGGLHGVGSSVVNALSEKLEVEVARDRVLWKQSYARGKPATKLVNGGAVHNRRGTAIRFKPDSTIFGTTSFSPARLYRSCRSKAYLFRGVQIRWACDPALLKGSKATTRRPRQCCISPAVSATASGKRKSDDALRAPPRGFSGAGEADLPAADPAVSNGPRRGSRGRGRVCPLVSATPFQRPRAVRTRRVSGRRC